jgi:hypothetical protein
MERLKSLTAWAPERYGGIRVGARSSVVQQWPMLKSAS